MPDRVVCGGGVCKRAWPKQRRRLAVVGGCGSGGGAGGAALNDPSTAGPPRLGMAVSPGGAPAHPRARRPRARAPPTHTQTPHDQAPGTCAQARAVDRGERRAGWRANAQHAHAVEGRELPPSRDLAASPARQWTPQRTRRGSHAGGWGGRATVKRRVGLPPPSRPQPVHRAASANPEGTGGVAQRGAPDSAGGRNRGGKGGAAAAAAGEERARLAAAPR